MLASFGVGYKVGSDGKKDLKNEVQDLKMELERKENDRVVEEKYRSKSALDVIRSFIGKGRKGP